MFYFNSVDIRCLSTSIRRLCDVKQTLKWRHVSTGKGIKFCIIGKVYANPRGLHPNLRDTWNLIPFKYISYLHKVSLLRFYFFPWKGYNFHRLKDIFCEYSIKLNEGITLLTPLPNPP